MFRLCSRANMTKVFSTRRWHNTKHPWEVLIFVLCHLRVERTFVMLARLQSRNKVPVVFRTNRLGLWTVDLTSRSLSSVPPKYVQGSEMAFIGKNIHLPVCWRGFMAMCLHNGNLLSFAWRWVGYEFMMSPAFYFFLRGETLKATISPNHLQWPPNCVQTHTGVQLR